EPVAADVDVLPIRVPGRGVADVDIRPPADVYIGVDDVRAVAGVDDVVTADARSVADVDIPPPADVDVAAVHLVGVLLVQLVEVALIKVVDVAAIHWVEFAAGQMAGRVLVPRPPSVGTVHVPTAAAERGGAVELLVVHAATPRVYPAAAGSSSAAAPPAADAAALHFPRREQCRRHGQPEDVLHGPVSSEWRRVTSCPTSS